MAKKETKKPTTKKAFKANYLVCVNKEDYSLIALKFAATLAEKNNASVTLLHVIEPIDYQSFGAVAEKMRAEQISDAEELLHDLAEEVTMTPALMVREGLIEEEIISVIENDPEIDMFIMGTAAESSVKSKIIPPLVNQLGNKLLIPMTIVPGNLTDEQIKQITNS